MRLWSLHPMYLDTKWLVALWREWLLARNVLLGNAKWYRNHPQLDRFKSTNNPIQCIDNYLWFVLQEAKQRGYSFDETKIAPKKNGKAETIHVTDAQIAYEFAWLKTKLLKRSPEIYEKHKTVSVPEVNEVFTVVGWDIETWERTIGGRTIEKYITFKINKKTWLI